MKLVRTSDSNGPPHTLGLVHLLQELPHGRLANPLLRPPQEGLQTRVGAQGIKDRITPQENHAARMLLMGFLQPFQRFFFFPQSGVKARNLLLGPLLCK
jgi:hypothetical protein